MRAHLIPEDRTLTPSAPEVAPTCSPTQTDTSARHSASSTEKDIDHAAIAARSLARAINSAKYDSNPNAATSIEFRNNSQICAPCSHKFQIRVLPSMTLRAFFLKLQKTTTSLGGRVQPQSHQAEQSRRRPFAIGRASSATPNELLTKPTKQPTSKTDHGSEVSSSSSSHPSSLSPTTASTTRLNQVPSPNSHSSNLGLAPPSTVDDYASRSSTTVHDQVHHRQPRLLSQSRPRLKPQLQPQLRAWLVMGRRSGDEVSELSYNGINDTRDIAWFGVEDGSDVVVWLED